MHIHLFNRWVAWFHAEVCAVNIDRGNQSVVREAIAPYIDKRKWTIDVCGTIVIYLDCTGVDSVIIKNGPAIVVKNGIVQCEKCQTQCTATHGKSPISSSLITMIYQSASECDMGIISNSTIISY